MTTQQRLIAAIIFLLLAGFCAVTWVSAQEPRISVKINPADDPTGSRRTYNTAKEPDKIVSGIVEEFNSRGHVHFRGNVDAQGKRLYLTAFWQGNLKPLEIDLRLTPFDSEGEPVLGWLNLILYADEAAPGSPSLADIRAAAIERARENEFVGSVLVEWTEGRVDKCLLVRVEE